jgi:hypothetical protein
MFLLELAIGICTYLAAKALWHFVVLRAQKDANFHNRCVFWLANLLVVLFIGSIFIVVGGGIVAILLFLGSR